MLAAAVTRASLLAWVADDAFISFRYAENWVAGHGFVYNVGEHVEGYTNFLWTLMVGVAMKLGFAPEPASGWMGIAAYVALVLCLARWSWVRSRSTGRPFLPVAAGIVLLSDDFHVWATGGLETMLFAYLACQAALWTRAEGDRIGPSAAAGVAFSLLVLTRPDGLLFAGAGVLSHWFPLQRRDLRRRLIHSAWTAVPVALTLAIGLPIKWHFYGDLFPTAFYSKSVLEPYFGQGLVYVGLYLAKNWYLPVCTAILLLLRRRKAAAALASPAPDRWNEWFFLGTAALFLSYLVEVGGDFMFARRVIPAVPLLLLALEAAICRIPTARMRHGLAAAALVGAALPIPLFDGTGRISGVSDEPAFYPPEYVAMRKQQAELVSGALAGTDVRAAFEGGMCMFGYYSGLPYLVETSGLTQYSLAKQSLVKRGRPGHEKGADGRWLTENEIHLVFSQVWPLVERDSNQRRLDEVTFGDLIRARIHIYSDDVMDALRNRPDISFVPIEEVLKISARLIEQRSLAESEIIYAGLVDYYFRTAGARGKKAATEFSRLIEAKREAESR